MTIELLLMHATFCSKFIISYRITNFFTLFRMKAQLSKLFHLSHDKKVLFFSKNFEYIGSKLGFKDQLNVF